MRTEAQKRASRKWDVAHYKTLAGKCKIEDYDSIVSYSKSLGLQSISKLVMLSIKYCMDNNIKLKDIDKDI